MFHGQLLPLISYIALCLPGGSLSVLRLMIAVFFAPSTLANEAIADDNYTVASIAPKHFDG
jgi:hypothetical protein